jgi:hypothetical protein
VFGFDARQCAALLLAPIKAERRRIMFATNVGAADRNLRIVLGLVLIALVVVGPQTQWGWLGLIPLATGLMRTCPLYALLGLNTCAK